MKCQDTEGDRKTTKNRVSHLVGETSIIEVGKVEKQDFSIADSTPPKIVPFSVSNRTIKSG